MAGIGAQRLRSAAAGRRRLFALLGAAIMTACTGSAPDERESSRLSSTVGDLDQLRLDVSVGTPSAPLGVPIELNVAVVNPTPTSESVDVRVELVDPLGDTVEATALSVFAGYDDQVSTPLELTPSQWFDELGTYEVVVSGGTDEAEFAPVRATFDVGPADVTVPVFTDVTDATRLNTSVPVADCGQFSNGAAFADIDLDGDVDLAVTRLDAAVQVYVQDDGTFTDVTEHVGIDMHDANGIGFADYDNDGDPDALVVGDGRDRLFENDGNGVFTDVSDSAGIGVGDDARGMDVAWGDYDNDGWLDVYVTNYMQCTGPWTSEAEIVANVEYDYDVLYRNRGDRTFEEATALLEGDPDDYADGATIGAGFGAVWIDHDGDGLPDLYLGNDFVGPNPDSNRMFLNEGSQGDGTWRFREIALATGTAFYMNTMGIGASDLDRDGDEDMVVSNVGASKLLRREGSSYVDDTESGIGRPTQQADYLSVTWGTVVADLNLDGWDDIYMGAGNFMQPPDAPTGVQPNVLYVSDGTGERWLDVSAATDADDTGDSKGVAAADYDGDGRIDLFVVNQDGSPRLYRNETPVDDRAWLAIDLVGNVSNRDGCGATISVDAGTGPIDRLLHCGSGGGGSGSWLPVHFGLGAATGPVRVVIDWPSGTTQTINDVAVNEIVTIEEDSA